jgi:hypothetical protein
VRADKGAGGFSLRTEHQHGAGVARFDAPDQSQGLRMQQAGVEHKHAAIDASHAQ